jgi:acetyl-CoA carboxylase biotin carboxyl carrier protein
MDIDLKQLRELMRALKQFDIHELAIEKGDEKIRLVREGGAPAGGAVSFVASPGYSMAPPPVPTAPASTTEAPAPAPLAADDPSLVFVTSPFVGTFYRSPSPDSPSFVEVGSAIRPGQVLCIVEAMKLMNEIESEIAGTVVELLVENGKPVEYGDKLFRVRKA